MRRIWALVSAAFLVPAGSAAAGDLVSASYALRAANLNSGSSVALSSTAPTPRFSSSSVSLGQSTAIGFASASGDLQTIVPGFWAIVSGAFPHLDVDGDLLAAFEDEDDDNDGLLDAVETNTGVFVSAGDVGSDPQVADSDGDGVQDGLEVALGFDPNDAQSLPQLPALAWFGRLALIAVLAGAGGWRLFPAAIRRGRDEHAK